MNTLIHKTTAALMFLVLSFATTADDIDIIYNETLYDSNVLFVMDLSGSMNWDLNFDSPPVGTDPTRLDVLRGAFQNIIADPDFDNINIGLSVFSGDAQGGIGKGKAHGITYPVSPMTGTNAQSILSKPGFVHPGVAPDDSYMPAAGTNDTRQYLSLLSADTTIWAADGSTPIVDALFEAARYFRGEGVYWGRHIASDIRSAHPATYNGLLSLNSSTVTPACTLANRVSCSKGSCGPTESCSFNPVVQTRADPTGGVNCTTNTGNTTQCGSGVNSCGLGTNCVLEVDAKIRYCASSISTTAACEAANPNWHSCETYTAQTCTTNGEGQSVCTDVTRVKCKEDLYRCDAADTYTCDFSVESCTKCPDSTNTATVDGSAIYKSPITEECPKNGIILLTDGFPTENNSANEVVTMIGGAYANGCDSGSDDRRCGPELASFLNGEDHANGSTSVPNINGTQNISTFTVGLALPASSPASMYLDDIATSGGGAFVNASTQAQLIDAFKLAITGIQGQARSFVSPSYSVDTSNLLSHGNDVYVPVFDRKGVVWPGNLKKFQLIGGVLSDADGNPATDANGLLLDTARDFWSPTASTDAVTSGGAANKINPASRTIKTDNGSGLIALNSSIANSEFGIAGTSPADNALKDDLVKYIKGINPGDNSIRHHMGDIIHSKPVQLNMAGGKKVIFVGSNEGYLHAINDSDGTEAFAYMPQELLPNIKDQYQKNVGTGHIYGVDSPLTLWLDESYQSDPSNSGADVNKIGNGILDANERAYLFFGLRRGGKAYYALDVTDPNSPVLVWKKSFGTGDSWSQPVVAQLKWKPNSNTKPVLVFGGGYNEDLSGNEIAGGDAVYIVDALTGAQVWSTKVAEADPSLAPDAITNAVPSRIRVLDVDRNGSIDRLYFGDTGGNIWRADLNASDYSGVFTDQGDISEAELHKFAELGGAAADNRKFFEEPDVAMFRRAGKFIATVSIGSGDRTKPLDASVNDEFFVLYDKELFALPTASPITMADSNFKSAPVALSDLQDPNFRGWHKALTSTTGEKVLSTAVTFQNKVMFTTFGTTAVTLDACNPSNENQARLYIMDLITGDEDTNVLAATGEILGTPQIIFEDLQASGGGPCTTYDCERKVEVHVGKVGPFALPPQAGGGGAQALDSLPRVYWLDNEK